MIAPSEFERYLKSICSCSDYKQWWAHGVLTDTEREQVEPFDFDLHVKEVKPQQDRGTSSESPSAPAPPLPVIQALHQYVAGTKHVLLVGRPGAGKTKTLIRYLLKLAKQALDDPSAKIPILVQLKDYKVSSDDYSGIVHFIRKDLEENWELSLKLEEIQRYLFKDRIFLLLVDGLNELSASQEARKDIRQFRDRCHKRQIPIVFVTRGLGYRDLGVETQLEIQPISPADRQRFLEERVSPGNRQKLQGWLNRARQSDYTPFVMWMLATVCQQVNSSSQLERFSLGEAFREFVRLYEDKLYEDGKVSEEEREKWASRLEHLASEMMTDERPENFVIPRVTAIEILESEALLNNLVRHHLLLERRGKSEIQFCHQLLQEYYVAEWLRRRLPDFLKDENSIKRFRDDYLNYLKWTEPIAIMLGLPEITENQAKQLIERALKVDLYLGARLAGEVKPEFQKKTIDLVISECEQRKLPPLSKVICLHQSRSIYSIQSLVEALNEPNADTQEKALQALEEIADAAVLPNLLQVIENPDGRSYPLVMDVIDLLVSLDSKNTTLPKLLELLKSQYPGIREIAALALGRFNTRECIPDLFQALNDPTIRVCRSVVSSLGKIGYQEIIPYLLKRLDRQGEEYDENMFSTAAFALAKLDPERAFSHPDAEVRAAVISLLENQNLEIALPRLEAALKDTNSIVRGPAIVMVGRLKAKKLLEEVLQALEEPDDIVQMQAAYALGQICSVEILPELLKKLENKECRTRRAVVDAMRNLDSEQAVPGLFQALVDSDQSVRRKALYTLGKLCRKTAIPYFIEIFLDPKNRDYNILLNNYLQELEPRRKSELLEQTNSQDIHIRWDAVKTLARVASHAAIPDLIKDFSKAKNVGHRWRLIDSLKSTANEQILPTLLDALNDQEVAIRRYAAFAIRDIGSCLHLPDLWQQQSRNPLEAIGTTIAAIQSRCQFYNYEIYQQAQAKEKPKFTDAAYLAPPTHITQNFYGSVYGVVGNVEGHQNIRSHNNSQHEYSKQEEYERILSTLHHMALVMERNPETFCAIGEEALRDHFLVQLNGTYEGQATGETSNGRGKTDIIVRLQGENIFIGECKFWGGEAKLQETLEQLLGYTTLRDNQLGMLIFNRNKGFSAVLEKIPAIIRNHPSFFREANHSETQFRFVLKHPDDSECKLNLAVLVFNIPSNSR